MGAVQMSLFKRRDERDRESARTLLAVLLLFIVSVLCAGIIMSLADWHQHLWFWGIGT